MGFSEPDAGVVTVGDGGVGGGRVAEGGAGGAQVGVPQAVEGFIGGCIGVGLLGKPVFFDGVDDFVLSSPK